MERTRKSSWLFAASLLLATPAAAQNQAVCDDLRGQLANVAETVGVNHKLRQYSSAIVEQTFEIRRLTNDLRDNECSNGSMVVIKGDGSNNETCARIEDDLKQVQENLQALTAKRDEVRHGSGMDGTSRDQIVTALHANGCDTADTGDNADVITNRPDVQPYSEFGDNDNAAIVPLDQSGGPSEAGISNAPAPDYAYGESASGNLRTVCVRTCDGGFFPMTAGATPGDFQRDGETCAKMCPGVKTELFFHRLPDQETSAMVSAATGAPYSSMPYAFAFRKRAPNEKSSCTCNLPAYYEEMRRENALTHPEQSTTGQAGSIITIGPKSPTPTTAEAAKPAPPASPPPDRPYDPSRSNVRQVGPQFLSSDQSKIDLKHPAGPDTQPVQ